MTENWGCITVVVKLKYSPVFYILLKGLLNPGNQLKVEWNYEFHQGLTPFDVASQAGAGVQYDHRVVIIKSWMFYFMIFCL